MKKTRYLLTLLLLVAAYTAAQGQVSFTVVPPGNVVVNDKFPVTYRLMNAKGSNFTDGQISGCAKLYGPVVFDGMFYIEDNGRVVRGTKQEYTVYYRATKAGTYTIPAASIMVNGKRYSTKPTKFTVRASAAPAPTPAASRPTSIDDIDTQSVERPVNSSDVFVRIILSRTKVYEQQAVECTIKLYTSYMLNRFVPTKQPSYDGFLIEDLDVEPELNRKEVLDGRTYATAVLDKFILFPQKSGRLTITSGEYDLTVTQIENINLNGMVTVRQPHQRNMKISSNSATVEVMPLPTPPEGFSGAVGQFKASSRMVGNRLRTGEAASMVLTISGTGNIKYIPEPKIDFPKDFDVYTPTSNVDAKIANGTTSGSMTVDYTFTPEKIGKYTIGAYNFIYFDPERREYITLNLPACTVNVEQGTGDGRDAVTAKNTDILDIISSDKATVRQPGQFVVCTVWYWLLFVVVAGGVTGAEILNIKRERLNSDVTGRRRAKARRVAMKRLAAANKALEAGQADRFYAEALKALTGYLGDKLGVPASQMSRDKVKDILQQRGASGDVVTLTDNVWDECEMARYTPGAQSLESMSNLYRRLTEVVDAIEQLKK